MRRLEPMKSYTRPSKQNSAKSSQESLANSKWYISGVVSLVVISIVATILIMRFFYGVHYNNLLLQANGATSEAQSKLGDEKHDVQFLIHNSNSQINCYQLQSSYDKGLCNAHNQLLPSQ